MQAHRGRDIACSAVDSRIQCSARKRQRLIEERRQKANVLASLIHVNGLLLRQINAKPLTFQPAIILPVGTLLLVVALTRATATILGGDCRIACGPQRSALAAAQNRVGQEQDRQQIGNKSA
jgi:hypothetical protein